MIFPHMTMKISGPPPPPPLQPVEVGEGAANAANSLVKKLRDEPDRNGVVLKNLLNATALGAATRNTSSFDLKQWANAFCRNGTPASLLLCYYQGHKAKPGEAFGQQLQRQLQEDLVDCSLQQQSADHLQSAKRAVEALRSLLERLMQIYELLCDDGDAGVAESSPDDEDVTTSNSTTSREEEEKEDLCWKIKFEVNQDGACTKYHDDLVDFRLVMTLVGDGTVLAADNRGVDWDYYEGCEGIIPALGDPDLSPADALKIIKAWNQRVVTRGELGTEPGDLVIMKGGMLTTRPCLHRAPYSAGEGAQPVRFLVTLDRISQNELNEFVEMELGAQQTEEEEEEGGEKSSRKAKPTTAPLQEKQSHKKRRTTASTTTK